MSTPLSNDSIVIVSAARTPIGGMLGDFTTLPAAALGAVAIKAAVERAGVKPEDIGETLFGNCLMAGQGQAPARQAVLGAGLPKGVGAVTLSKMCGSGMKAAMMAADMIAAGTHEVMIAGGMESMTNAPHLLVGARKGYRYGAATMFDHMAMDGLEDAYERGKAMGVFAENCNAKYGFTREAQDAFAIASTERALAANKDGSFDWEIAPVTISGKAGDTIITHDEQPFKAKLDKIPTLNLRSKRRLDHGGECLQHQRRRGGDGLDESKHRDSEGFEADSNHRRAQHACARARVVRHGARRRDSESLEQGEMESRDVDLWEINEAFASVTMAAMKEFDLPHSKVNIHGGACALGIR